MVTALVAEFGRHYDQIILVGEAAFIKHVLELGQTQQIDWQGMLIHVAVGEEPLAENARKYFEDILGIDLKHPETGLIISSMGVAELGLNLFCETPSLVALRRVLHENSDLRRAVLGPAARNVPMLFAYDPSRSFVEVLEDGRLAVSTLEPERRLPLVRYVTGDRAAFPQSEPLFQKAFEESGLAPDELTRLPVP
jgi:phenylacetate-CoA ligase